MTTIALAGAAGAVTLVATPLAAVLARRLNVMDHPGPLKPHARPIPYLGGLAVFAGAVIAPAFRHAVLIVPLGMALALGVADDAISLSPRLRFGCEVGIGIAAAAVIPTRLPGPIGPVAVTLATIVLINAVNLIDGLDGLAGGVALVAAAGFAVLLHGSGPDLALGLAAALAGFLVWNRPPARIYLGDGGAYLLGTALALLLAQAWRPGVKLGTSIGALAIVALPVAEMTFSILRRLRTRAQLFEGDRGHGYDRLVDRGWSRPSASLCYIGAEAILGGAGLGLAHVSPVGAALGVLALSAALILAAAASGFLGPLHQDAEEE